MLGRPCQHGAGNPEIVMLAGRAFIDNPGITQLRLERHQLLMRASAHRTINDADLIRLQFAMVELEQIGPADGIDQHHPILHRPSLQLHAITVPADLRPITRGPKVSWSTSA